MQESGQISDLRKKWWREKRGGGKCEVSNFNTKKKNFIIHYLIN